MHTARKTAYAARKTASTARKAACTVRRTAELDDAKHLLEKLVRHLQANRIEYSRARLLRVQSDLSALTSRASDAQRIISIYMMERERTGVPFGSASSPLPVEDETRAPDALDARAAAAADGLTGFAISDARSPSSAWNATNEGIEIRVNGSKRLLRRSEGNWRGARTILGSLFGSRLRWEAGLPLVLRASENRPDSGPSAFPRQ